MLARKSTVVGATVLAVVLGLAATALMPGPQTPIGLLASAFASPASAQPGVETIEGEVSGYKYSPSGSHADGFYLDANGLLPGNIAVGMPPHAASYMLRQGSSVKVSGVPHTSPHEEEIVNAVAITDNETGQTFEISDSAGAAALPHGGPGFGPAAAPPPVAPPPAAPVG